MTHEPYRMTDEEVEEMKAKLREAMKAPPRPKPKPVPKPAAEQLVERGANRPTVAMAQDVALGSDALAQRLHEERETVFSDKELAQRQAVLDIAYAATRRVQQEIVFLPYHRRSVTVGQGDSDYHLHVSPEDQLWGRMK